MAAATEVGKEHDKVKGSLQDTVQVISPWGVSGGDRDSYNPGPEPQEERQGQGWMGQLVGAQGLRRSAGSLQKAPGQRGPSSGHPALPGGCGHWVLGAHAVSVMVCVSVPALEECRAV